MLSSYPEFVTESWAEMVFLVGLFGGIALGAGGIKPNVVVLGADQFDMSQPEQIAEKDRFFNYFYWAINIGAAIAYGWLANMSLNGQPSIGISPRFGFFASFVVPLVAMAIGFSIFVVGTPRYKKVPPRGSALGRFFGTVFEAGAGSWTGIGVLAGGGSLMWGTVLTICSYFVPSSADAADTTAQQALSVSGMAILVLGLALLIICGQGRTWLEVARRERGGTRPDQDVADAGQVTRLLPYMALIVIFWACYAQMSTNFILQGCQMNLVVGSGPSPWRVSSAFLNLFDTIIILIFIPIFDNFVYPGFARCLGRPLSVMQKIGAGFLFTFVSMAMAGGLEIWRKQAGAFEIDPCCANNVGTGGSSSDGGVSNCSATCVYSSNCAAAGTIEETNQLSIWWQVPQYAFIGIAEILTSITSYELFYSQVPPSMRSVCQALNLLTTSLGYMVAGGINSVFSSWINPPAAYAEQGLNRAYMENIFFVAAGTSLVTFFVFVFVSQGFQYTPTAATASGLEKGTSSGGGGGGGSVDADVSGLSPEMSRFRRASRSVSTSADMNVLHHLWQEQGHVGVGGEAAGRNRRSRSAGRAKSASLARDGNVGTGGYQTAAGSGNGGSGNGPPNRHCTPIFGAVPVLVAPVSLQPLQVIPVRHHEGHRMHVLLPSVASVSALLLLLFQALRGVELAAQLLAGGLQLRVHHQVGERRQVIGPIACVRPCAARAERADVLKLVLTPTERCA